MSFENPTQPDLSVSEASDQKENLDTVEAGRLKERLVEMIKIIPGTMADIGRIWVLAAKALGTPEEKIAIELKGIMDRMTDRAEKGRENADRVFEKRISPNK